MSRPNLLVFKNKEVYNLSFVGNVIGLFLGFTYPSQKMSSLDHEKSLNPYKVRNYVGPTAWRRLKFKSGLSILTTVSPAEPVL